MEFSEGHNLGSSLSKRSDRIPIDLSYVQKYSSWPAIQNPYDQTGNPNGIINFGTAVSGLMDDIWLDRLKALNIYKPVSTHFRYYQFWGPDYFRKNLADFMTTFFNPRNPIDFQNLFVLNGAVVAIDILGFLLADEKDVFLCPVPGYNSYFQAGKQRWNVEIISVPFQHHTNGTDVTFRFDIETLESVLATQKSLGRNVRAFILNNPNNPLGIVIDNQTVEAIMRICNRERIHLIADEMYCMSVFDKSAEFQSVLQIRTYELLDPQLMHVIWGFSKDLCLTGFRTGVIHTQNPELQLKLKAGSQFQAVSLPTMDMLSNIISDIDWFRNEFVPLNLQRLRTNHAIVSERLTSMGIPISISKAGFFLLANFSAFLKPFTQDTCKQFIETLYKNKVYITPGWEMRGEPGWFRIVFTLYPTGKGLEEGLNRLELSINEWKTISK